eukprot:tig00021071_g17951.t1
MHVANASLLDVAPSWTGSGRFRDRRRARRGRSRSEPSVVVRADGGLFGRAVPAKETHTSGPGHARRSSSAPRAGGEVAELLSLAAVQCARL